MDRTAVKIITYFNNLEEFLIGILFFTLPFGWTFSIIPLVLATTILLVNTFTKPQKPNKDKILYFLPPIAMFLWNSVSLLYTEDINNGLSLLSTQLTLIIATIAFLFNKISQSTINKGIFMYLTGCLCSIALLHGIAFFNSATLIGDAFVFRPFFENTTNYMLDTDTTGNYYLGSAFSNLVHPSYYALMLGIAMMLIIVKIDPKSRIPFNGSQNFWLVIFAIFGIAIIQFSINGTIVLITAITLVVLAILSIKKINYSNYNNIIYAITLLFFCLLLINPQTLSYTDKEENRSITLRKSVTEASLGVIADNWLMGVGIGDIDKEMELAFTNLDKFTEAKKSYNSHNQFLTTWAQSGIVGVFLLVWCFIAVSKRGFKKKEPLLHLFNIVVIISFMFESMLIRYWGVLTFIIFYSTLYFYTEDEKKLN